MMGITFGHAIMSMVFVIVIFIHIYICMGSFCVILIAKIFVSVFSSSVIMMMAIIIVVVVVIDFLVICLLT
mgnify:CR=1 FL=1